MTKIIPRFQLKRIKKWLADREIIAIIGARQVGKTTLLHLIRQELIKQGVKPESITFVNFENRDLLAEFVKFPKEFVASYFLKEEPRHYFLFDEYQYVPEGGQKLKLLWDEFPQAKFIITGSSSLELRGDTFGYLVGRVISFPLYSFSFNEFLWAKDIHLAQIHQQRNQWLKSFLEGKEQKAPSLLFSPQLRLAWEEYLVFGGYPAVVLERDREKKKQLLHSIRETYVEKDIIGFLQIGKFMEFVNLVKILAFQIGSLVNYQSISSDTGLTFRRLKKYLDILEQTFVLQRLYPFHRNLITELRKNPKVYFYDSGLRNSLIDRFSSLADREDRGQLAENAVFDFLVRTFGKERIKFWRTTAKAEVDFCLEKEEIIPIEVKFSPLKKEVFGKSFLSFLASYQSARAVIFTDGFFKLVKKGKTSVCFCPLWWL